MSVKMQVILSEEMDEHIRSESKKLGLSMSAYANLLMSEAIRTRENLSSMQELGRALSLMPDDLLAKEIEKYIRNNKDNED